MRRLALALITVALVPSLAHAGGDAHAGFASTLLALTIVLAASKAFGDLAQRLGQPAVLGELFAGMVLGNLRHLGLPLFSFIGEDNNISMLAELGVILLLFEVGLESTVRQMLAVGPSALLVAVLGVVTPMLLGFGASAWLLPESSNYVHLFLGATLSATSVGITARVLKDLGRSQSGEARVILGAAVIDDVLGLIVLATVSALVAAADRGEQASIGPILLIVGKTVVFLVGAIGLGSWLAPIVYRFASKLRATSVLLALSLAFCFGLSWASAKVGLAPIVGAFAAGLVLESATYEPFTERGEHELEHLVAPVVSFLSPVFFVVMGFRVDLSTFADTSVLGLALALCVAAVIGKQACSLGVLDRSIRRLPVGLGMIPRGEVGLIFANIGLTLTIGGVPLVTPGLYSAIVIMVIVTTLITPPLLTWSLGKGPPIEAARAGGTLHG